MDTNNKHKWAPGDAAMMPVTVLSVDLKRHRATVGEPDYFSVSGFDLDALRPCDPPGHGPHLDAAKLLYKIGLMRGSALCWCDNAHRQGYLEALDEVATKVRAAIAAQGADDER